jgi:hypothetical protein
MSRPARRITIPRIEYAHPLNYLCGAKDPASDPCRPWNRHPNHNKPTHTMRPRHPDDPAEPLVGGGGGGLEKEEEKTVSIYLNT